MQSTTVAARGRGHLSLHDGRRRARAEPVLATHVGEDVRAAISSWSTVRPLKQARTRSGPFATGPGRARRLVGGTASSDHEQKAAAAYAAAMGDLEQWLQGWASQRGP
jgi:hypothetical protein